MTEKLPTNVQEFVRTYFELPLNGKKVQAPYYINIKKIRQRMGLRVLIGKGTPEEIIQETLIYEKLRGVDLAHMSIDEIREFMVKRRIGIDCSGFIVHILDHWLRSSRKKHLWSYMKFPKTSIYSKIARKLRPVEAISTEILCGDLNSKPITNLNEIRVGDVIRSRLKARSKKLKRGYHCLLISEINRDGDNVKSFKYIHSSRRYEDKHGVREGEVIVKDPKAHLCEQEWTEVYNGRNWTLEEICEDTKYSQVRRLHNVPVYN